MSIADQSHSRRNPLTGEWVLVSPHRLQRPWQGQLEDIEAEQLPEFDTDCYLCPGNKRANDNQNPEYRGTFAFDNDFSALSADSKVGDSQHPLLRVRAEPGYCRVLCYTERHDLRLATMADKEVCAALQAMIVEFKSLDQRHDVSYVQIFENRGSMMGCSNPHPHAQIWATAQIPTEPVKELTSQAEYMNTNDSSLLVDYVHAELQDRTRVIHENKDFVAFVPYWAVWPYEVLILPRRDIAAPDELVTREVTSLAHTLGTVLRWATIVFSALLRPTRWAFMRVRPTGKHIPSGSFTGISIRRCCDRLRCASTWLALRCWPCRSAT